MSDLISGNGGWPWWFARNDGDYGNLFDRFLEASVEYEHTLTACAVFTNKDGEARPRHRTERLAEVIARRVERYHERTGGSVLVYVENYWYEPWRQTWGPDELVLSGSRNDLSDEQYRWNQLLTETTRGLPIIWGACLEPHHQPLRWLELMASNIRLLDPDGRPVSHNGNFAPAPKGFDLYEDGVSRHGNAVPSDFYNSDHDRFLRQEKNPDRQLEKLKTIPADLPCLIVSKYFGVGLEDWNDNKGTEADWQHNGRDDRPMQAVGARNTPQQPPVPEPEPDRYEALAKAIRDRDWHISYHGADWKWDDLPVEGPGGKAMILDRTAKAEAERDKARRA